MKKYGITSFDDAAPAFSQNRMPMILDF